MHRIAGLIILDRCNWETANPIQAKIAALLQCIEELDRERLVNYAKLSTSAQAARTEGEGNDGRYNGIERYDEARDFCNAGVRCWPIRAARIKATCDVFDLIDDAAMGRTIA